jgi:hypothetical protein
LRVSVPQLGKSFEVPQKELHPYTSAEQSKALHKLTGRSIFIGFQNDIDGPQTATRLIRETLEGFGVAWVETVDRAEAVIWIQAGSAPMRFAFVVAHPTDAGKFVAAECGPRELTATIMTGVGEFFSSHRANGPEGEVSQLIACVNELNRAITGASITQDWVKARKLMNDLRVAVEKLGSMGRAEAVKPVIDALADSADSHANTGFPEAASLREASIVALASIGKKSIPWIKKGLTHSSPAVREACDRALKACGEKPWWQFW